jgi:predicted permease
MTWLRRVAAGFHALVRRRRVEQELDAELRACMELSVDAKVRSGMTQTHAIRAARVEMGSLEAAKDDTRDVGWETRLESLWRDVCYAVRTLRRSPAFTVVAVLTLALGIGANTALFTIVDQLLLRLLPVREPRQLVSVVSRGVFYGDSWTTPGRPDGSGLSYPMYVTLRHQNDVFDDMFARFNQNVLVSLKDRVDRAEVDLISGNYFQVLGVHAALGRTILPSDDAPNEPDVVVLSHRYWRSALGADPDVVGRTIAAKTRTLTIVGVAQEGFDGTDIGIASQLFVPIRLVSAFTSIGTGRSRPALEEPRVRWLLAFGRLKPGTSLEQAKARLQPLYAARVAIEVQDEGFARASEVQKARYLQTTIAVQPGGDGISLLRQQLAQPLWILMAIVGVVLLIACANLANLSLGRVAARERELALRRALGASRQRLAQHLFVESVLLAAAGGVIGLAIAWWGARALLAYVPAGPGVTLTVAPAPDGRILAFTTAVAVLTSILFGMAPALRSGGGDVGSTLKNEAGTIAGGHGRLRRGFVVAQVSLSLLLLVGAGLFVRSLRNLLHTNLGVDAGRTLTFQVELPGGQRKTLLTELSSRLAGTAGIANAAYSSSQLLSDAAWGSVSTIEGRPLDPDHHVRSLNAFVSPLFFRTMGIPLLQGRDFDVGDQDLPSNGTLVFRIAIANRTYVERYLAGRQAIGTHIGLGDDPGTPTPIEIVGVVGDAKYRNVREDMQPQLYFPYPQGTRSGNVTMYVRSSRDAVSMLQTARRVVRDFDPAIPVFDVRTLDDQVAHSLSTDRLTANLAAMFGGLATLLAMVGLYGVLAYTVTRRTREIGVRIALGAPARSISWLVLREVLVVVGVGVAFALPAVWLLTRLVNSQLYGLTPMDPIAIAGALTTLTLVAIVAGSLPARQAAHVDPVVALRAD